MLDAIGVGSVDDLFSDIPRDILLDAGLDLPDHLSEFEVYNHLRAAAEKNITGISFLGGGVYDHLIPSVVPFVVSRSEFLTAYTPYQAEMSQGILQAMFEYQTLACMLTGLDVSNASLYDGATAAAEACAMAVNSVRGGTRLLYSPTLFPHTVEVLKTFFSTIDIELVCIDSDPDSGTVKLGDLDKSLEKGVAGVLVQSPNRYGCVEDYTGFAEAVHAAGAKLIISANPISLGLLKSPGEWGADIAVGDGQPCGLFQNYGGPGVGYICAATDLLRKMPGRIVGETKDSNGERAFVLTLQAREQHIKRERATSNICTNQALAALGVAAYLACMGPAGIRDAARHSHSKARYLYERLVDETAAEPVFTGPFFNEFVLRMPIKSDIVVEKMVTEGFQSGVPLEGAYEGAEFDLLIAVTEKRTREELDGYVESLKRVIV
jgi:glycine dehydrogenase subunit 1